MSYAVQLAARMVGVVKKHGQCLLGNLKLCWLRGMKLAELAVASPPSVPCCIVLREITADWMDLGERFQHSVAMGPCQDEAHT